MAPTGVGRSLAVAAVALVVQVSLTGYPDAGGAAASLTVGLGLLALVRRGSRVARLAVVLIAWVGCVVYAVTAPDEGWTHLLVALAFAGQGVPMGTRAVRERAVPLTAAARPTS